MLHCAGLLLEDQHVQSFDFEGKEDCVGKKKKIVELLPDKLQLLNTHLGKAGGLNFGLEAVLHTLYKYQGDDGSAYTIPLPSKRRPLILAICDARHVRSRESNSGPSNPSSMANFNQGFGPSWSMAAGDRRAVLGACAPALLPHTKRYQARTKV